MASSSCVLTETHGVAAPERVITELTRGREIADRLRLMLRETGFDGFADPAFPAQSLVNQLLDTFTHSLTMLCDGVESDEVSQIHSAAARSEDSGDSCKTPPPPPPKDRRGCYKRKRNSESVVKESSNLFEDGHAWRKYGQKVILNAKHPRNYFRCTHKYDQGCQASKQVQKVQDNPPLYRTTYNGHHTCNSTTNTNNLLLKSSSSIFQESLTPDSSEIWNFTKTPSLDSPIKQETIISKEQHVVHQTIIKSSSSPSSSSSYSARDYYVLPKLAALDDEDQFNIMSSDVYSCTSASPHGSTIDDVEIMGSIEHLFDFGTL